MGSLRAPHFFAARRIQEGLRIGKDRTGSRIPAPTARRTYAIAEGIRINVDNLGWENCARLGAVGNSMEKRIVTLETRAEKKFLMEN
jgi:hypothetical protein